MFDTAPEPAAMQRSKGRAEVELAARAGRAGLLRLYQSGSARAILPRVHHPVPEVVFLNTSGGLTGGDRLELALRLGPGCRAAGTTQTAERAYASGGGLAHMEVTLEVGGGGRLDWLPQETILYDGAALARRTTVDLAGNAACLLAETVILGRAAMGETVGRLDFRDERLVRRDARPVLVEPLRLDGAALAAAHGPAVLGGARAFATLALVERGAEDAAGPLRAVLDEPGVEGGVSGFDGKCVLRLLAADALPLKRQLVRALAVLRGGPPPRVWQI